MKSILYGFVLAAMMLPAGGLAQQNQDITLEERAPGVYEVMGGSGADSGIVIGSDAVAVIDAKMNEESVRQVLDRVETLAGMPVTYLINTHSDGDHVTGNRYFPRSVTIIAHDNCREEFFHEGRDGSRSEWHDEALQPYIPEITFTDRMTVHLGDRRLELHHFGPGHTTGDIVVYLPDENIAFLGDQAFPGRPQLIHSYKGGTASGHVANLERMLDTLGADRYFTGHGETLTPGEIRAHIAGMQEMQEKVRSLKSDGMSLVSVQQQFEEPYRTLAGVIYSEVPE